MFFPIRTTLLDRIKSFLMFRITKDPKFPSKQVKKDWKFSKFSRHIKVYGEKRTHKDFNILAVISTPNSHTVNIKPTKLIKEEDLKTLKEVILHWTPSLTVTVEGVE